ncbi:MAG TPA: sugar MFS transporter [Sphingomicrobium sp.]|jgi:FHS family L-fucose permease-like MFS transporter|nr:sugar MFS transporter [Sphingomicrobium sp.]
MQQRQAAGVTGAYVIVTCLFFAWGFITSLVDPLVAAVKGVFHLSDVEAQLSAFAFFIAYGVMSLPGAVALARLKSVPSVLISLALMVLGCLVMLAAANLAIYPVVLLGLFVLASGITILQVAANPLSAALGSPERSHFRLTFSQAFNSLGTFIGPYLGASLFLKGVEVKKGTVVTPAVRAASLHGVDRAFFWIAGLIILIGILIYSGRKMISAAAPPPPHETAKLGIAATVHEAISSPWALFGGVAIFLYVGAEVSIGTQMALFLNSTSVWNVALERAGKFVSLYWGGAMVGRLIGSALLTKVKAPRLLAVFTGIACLLCLFVFSIGGIASGYAALSIGLFNSIMFPVIFTITLERSSASEEATSGFLCFSIVGGAVLPLIVGLVSQHSNYVTAFIVPAICYAILFLFSLASGRARTHHRDEPAAATIH